MKSRTKKLICLVLCTMLVISSVGGALFALAGNEEANEQFSPAAQEDMPDAAALPDGETVYVIAGADGSAKKIIVSDGILSALGETAVSESGGLNDIPGGTSHVWDAWGNDFYYRGDIDSELPVDVKLSFTLDGQSISPDELQGKSGKVTIRFDYENRQYETVEINGRYEKIYVPFAMLTGLSLDNDVFSNVTISNGRLMNDGSRTIAAGIAFPGLQESLGLNDDKLELPDYVEITADAEDFSLGMTVTVASAEVFGDIDFDDIDSIDGLSGSVDELTGAMDRLVGGSSALYDGLCTLLDRSEQLADGIDRLAIGSEALKNGAAELDGGVGQLESGAAALADGLDTLAADNDSLNGGARQVFDMLLSTAQTQLSAAGLDVPDMTVGNYASVLNAVIASLDSENVYAQALASVTEAVEANRGYITEQVTASVREQVASGVSRAAYEEAENKVTEAVRSDVEAKVTASVLGDAANIAALQAAQGASDDTGSDALTERDDVRQAILENTEAQMASDKVRTLIAQKTEEAINSDEVRAAAARAVEEKMASDEIKTLIEQNVEAQIAGAVADAMAGEDVQARLASASEGARQVITLKTSLDSYNAFYLGLRGYTAGVAQAAGGAEELRSGAAKLKAGSESLCTGSEELYNGVLTMKSGVPALIEGVSELRDGSMTLSGGLKEFNERGVAAIIEAADDIPAFAERAKATIDAARNYHGFAGGADSNIRFVYRTDEIGG